jgi:hypothetical protein
MKTTRPINLKTGEKYDSGLEIVSWCPDERPTICEVRLPDGRIIKGRIRLVLRTPSDRRIAAWCADSVCESVMGDTVEPDGYDSHGSPSWLLALGLV